MRRRFSILLTVLLLALFGIAYVGSTTSNSTSSAPTEAKDVLSVNAILGNESYRTVFNTRPSTATPERLRLQTHLAVVEEKLRSRDVSHLSPQQRTRRSELLDEIQAYWKEGQFPRNTEVPGRTPVFIDEDGRLCAVGHLIAVSVGRSLAASIDEKYHLAQVRDMELSALDRWAEQHGFSPRELQMIQPSYCNHPCTTFPEEEDETASALEITTLSASIGASLLNGVLLERESPTVVGGAVGVAGGATSLTLGLTDGAKYPTASTLTGASSLILGGWTLINILRGDRSEEPPSPTDSDPDLAQNWQIGPTTITTVDGTTQPGIQASLQF